MITVLNTLLEITVFSAVLYGAILLFKIVFRKHISAVLNYAVWALLILRLIIPVTVDSGIHFVTIPDDPKQAVYTAASNSNASLRSYTPLAQSSEGNMSPETQAIDEIDNTVANNQNQIKPWDIGWQTVLVLIWGAGVLFSFGFVTIIWRRLSIKIRRCGTEAPEYMLKLVNQCKSDMGIKADIGVSVQRWLKSPALSASLKPMLLLPEHMLHTMEARQLEFGIRHELVHYQRRDYLMNILLMALRCVYWFNPVIYLAFRNMQVDMETACDVHITSRLKDAERIRYIRTIIELGGSGNVQCVLGMGMSKGGKEMEKRVRGIFMRKRTRLPARMAAALLAGLMLVACFTTACQPTPEKEVVINKGGDKLADEINATPAPEGKYQAPARYELEAQSFYDNMLSVSFDMQVETPDVSAYPVYTVKDADLTQQQVDRIVSALMQDKPLKYYDEELTKQEITEIFLLPEKKRLSEAKSGKEVSDDGGNISIEQIQNNIDMYEQWAASAPETRDEHGVTAEDYTTSGSLSVMADLGKSSPATLKIARAGQTFYFLQFINGTEYIYNGFGEPSEDLPLKTTKEQAIATAAQLVSDMGAEDFKLAAVGKTTRLGSEYEISSDEYQNTMAYSVVFTRTVDGIPLTYTSIDSVSISDSDKDKMDAETWSYERIMVNIDDNGVANVFWNGNLEIGACVNENVRLMKFEDIASRAMEQIKIQNAFLTDQGKEGEGLQTKRLEFDINKAKLGFTRLRVKDSAEYQIVPVWDFYGSTTYYRDENEINAFNKEHGTDLKSTELYSSEYRALVTINAVDGSAVDRNLGY